MCTQFVVAKGFLVANPNLDLLIHNRIGLMNTLLSGTAGTLCSLGKLCSPALFTQHILLPGTFCPSTQFTS